MTSQAANRYLKESERVLSLLPVAGLIVSEDRVLFTNNAARELLGRERTTTGVSYLEGVHPDDRANERALMEDLYSGAHTSYRLERRQQGAQQTLWLQSQCSVLPAPGPGPKRLIITLSDFTLLKGYERAWETEEALRLSEDKFRLVMEQIPEIFWIANTSGRHIEYISPAYHAIVGASPEEVYRHALVWMRYILAEDLPAVRSALAGGIARAPGETVLPEFRIRRPDGELRWIRARGSILPAEGERPERIAGIAEDITRQKSYEEQLQQSEKMQAIGQLAGGMAHDFNNQLAGIMGYADALSDGVQGDPRLAGYADSLIQCVNRAAGLTAQLLAFARKGKFLASVVDLHAVIFEVVSLLKHSIDKRIRIRQRLDANPSITQGDPDQLQNAILNLALNARDAMPTGGDLVFETETFFLNADRDPGSFPKLQVGEYVRIRVSDSGTGMPPEVVRHIFEPFFTTKSAGQGTGMGLAAVYGTIRNHHGFVEVHSTPGQGSTFEVFLRAHKDAVVDTSPLEQAPASGQGRVLLIDDEKSVLATGQIMLEALGYRVSRASNGGQAIKVFQADWRDFDLVILDMTMPVMSGSETFRTLRQIDPDVTVLLASGYSVNGEVQSLLDAGARAFIQKPYRKADLRIKLAEMGV